MPLSIISFQQELHTNRRFPLQACVRNLPDNHLTSSLKKHAFYNLLINNILYLCVT